MPDATLLDDESISLEDVPYRRLQFALKNPTIVRGAYHGAFRRARRLREQLRELDIQIRQAEAFIGEMLLPSWPPLPEPHRPPTLHQAIQLVLDAKSNQWMPTATIAREIARNKLYRRRDGLAASTKDVSARVSSYSHLFERLGDAIRMRTEPLASPLTPLGADTVLAPRRA
jgi:hypothetical protein